MAGYLGASPVPQTIQKKETITATAGQTTFNTTGYTDGNFINVFLNGVRLVNGTDYTATNGSDIVLASAASASDVLDFETFNEFQLTDQEFADSVIIENNTSEDSDGGRASKLVYKGKQSGGEQSTLAEIQASHDGTADDQKADLIFKTNDGSDGTSPTERARIDSSGNFLVGKVASDYDGGVFEAGTGGTFVSRTGTPFGVNRNGSNGSLTNFYKDGGSVGTIEVNGNDNIRIAASAADHGGLEFATHIVAPLEAGSGSDGTIDLGAGSARFKDLYLGGGVFLGGTGADNKLEDYEEGTFTPTATFSLTSVSTIYRKIGKLVHVGMKFTTGSSSSSAVATIGGLPFANVSNNASRAGLVVGWNSNGIGAGLTFLLGEGTTTGVFYLDGQARTLAQMAGNTVYIGGTYPTAS